MEHAQIILAVLTFFSTIICALLCAKIWYTLGSLVARCDEHDKRITRLETVKGL